MADKRIPSQCRPCANLHTGGIKDGKHDRWCCKYGKPAPKATGECRMKDGFTHKTVK